MRSAYRLNIEVVSKSQIMFEDKVRGNEKVAHTREYVSPPEVYPPQAGGQHFELTRNLSVLWRIQPSGIRGGIGTTSELSLEQSIHYPLFDRHRFRKPQMPANRRLQLIFLDV